MAITDGLISHFLLNNNASDYVGGLNGSVSGTVDFDGSRLDPLLGSVTIPSTGGVWCSYWKDTGSGFSFYSSFTILSILETDKYSNIRVYDAEKTGADLVSLQGEGANVNPLRRPTISGLVRYYPLAGNAVDLVAGDVGVDIGNTYIDDSEFGTVSDFQGGDDRIEAALSLASPQYLGFSIWLYNRDPGSNSGNTLVGGDGDGYYEIYQSGSSLQFYVDGGLSQTFDTPRIDSEWTHYYISANSITQEAKMYVNGVFGDAPPDSFSLGALGPLFYIGGWGTSYNFIGSFRNVRVYTEPITDQEIEDIYVYETNIRGAIPLVQPLEIEIASTSDMTVSSTVTLMGAVSLSSATTLVARREPIFIASSTSSVSMSAGIDIEVLPISIGQTSNMSVIAEMELGGEIHLSSSSIISSSPSLIFSAHASISTSSLVVTIDSLLAGNSVFITPSSTVAVAGGIYIEGVISIASSSASSASSSIVRNGSIFMTPSSSASSVGDLETRAFIIGEWFLTANTKSGYAVVVENDAFIDFTDTECKFSDIVEGDIDHGTIFHDPIHLNFVNRGYPNTLDCEPHEGNDYTDTIFPFSRDVSISILGNNRSIVGSKIDTSKALRKPNVASASVTYSNTNIQTEFLS